ncbi:MAG: hypothetical protein RSF73_09580, partial [Ruthenibacterium sp.]
FFLKSTKNTYFSGGKFRESLLLIKRQKTIVFNISTGFYTEYSRFGENLVENPVESVDNCAFVQKVFNKKK